MISVDAKKRFVAASKLIGADAASIEKFEAVRDLIKGLNPRADRLLEKCSETISKVEKLQKSEVVDLTAEALPENTEEEKRRKKAILLFIRSWKELEGEIERIRTEFESGQESGAEQAISLAKIAAFAKGPFGILTIAAVLIAGALIFLNGNKEPGVQISAGTGASSNSKVQVINYNGKKIALSQLEVREGPDCDSPHYHAKYNGIVKVIDGSSIVDPGSCAFGRVKETQVEEIDAI